MEIKDMTAVQLSAAIKEGIRREVTPDSFFDAEFYLIEISVKTFL